MKEHSPTPPSPHVYRDQLIEQHRSYVRALAVKIMRSLPLQVDLNELVAYGDIGLIEAAERYDARRGVAFTTFSYYRIKGAIYDGLREMGLFSRTISTRSRFTAHANDLIQTAAADLSQAEDTMPSVEDEIAATQALFDTLIPAYFLSLESDSLPEIADPHAFSNERMERRDMAGYVLKLLAELTEEEQQLIDRLYFKHHSMTHLAAEMGVTKSWISRLHSRAIQHLRDHLRQQGLLQSAD
jgi:RNA polymerase sigma factor for flagellar operon FliA